MTTIPKVLGCECWRVGTHSSRSPCGDEPRSQVHLVLDKAVNQRQRLCFKLLAAEKKVPPLVGCTNETGDGGKGPEGIQCFGVPSGNFTLQWQIPYFTLQWQMPYEFWLF